MKLFGFGREKASREVYDGLPFLQLVESFVLQTIGCLPPEQEARLQEMTPKLQAAFNRSGSWEEIVVAELHLPADAPAAIRSLWHKKQLAASQKGTELAPAKFVEMVMRDELARRS